MSGKLKKEVVQMIDDALTRSIDRLHGSRYNGNCYVQPLHHHSYKNSLNTHSRDKIKEA